ncbi:hypothetical protein DFP73DRAFT_569554 [Morchella snyderi]|nr:hypothetical protein DFP73DRAFT_569554 [Morchella snyderi]
MTTNPRCGGLRAVPRTKVIKQFWVGLSLRLVLVARVLSYHVRPASQSLRKRQNALTQPQREGTGCRGRVYIYRVPELHFFWYRSVTPGSE